nr:class I SAM-dependent methyltransferase [uncultured Methanospirillum sp.]
MSDDSRNIEQPDMQESRPKTPSRMAEGMAMHRLSETMLPEDVRIFSDPYAVHFINPEILKFAAEHPREAEKKVQEMENLFPGLGNSIRARVKYFDLVLNECISHDFAQLIILGAGYDTRPYRTPEIDHNFKVFEVDHPETQSVKKEIIRRIFGTLPDNVTYIPLNLETGDLDVALSSSCFSELKKTLVIMEGLIMYLSSDSIHRIFQYFSKECPVGSKILFDYYPESVVSGEKNEYAKNIVKFTQLNGEPLKFGIPDHAERNFLSQWNFADIRIIRSEEYKNLLFTGKNADRSVCDFLSFMEVTI